MIIKRPSDIPPSEITSEAVYRQRRRFLQGTAGLAAGLILGGCEAAESTAPAPGTPLPNVKPGPYGTDEERTPYDDVTSYNNFYEFGFDKEDPKQNAGSLKTRPWSIAVEGEVEQPGHIDIDDLLKMFPLEERVYRLRCVEAWSMVVPWVGFPLARLIQHVKPTSKARFVEFTTLYDPKQMPGQRVPALDWPYREGLRMDEATHPLALLVVGLYGKVLPNQNGAPLRLIVPWKYGFKSIKSIVRLRLIEQQPVTTWNQRAPTEYGFYANVNPKVDHPRWSQKRERRIGDFFKRDTLMFNGYAEQVASLYTGMDLKKNF